MPRHRYVPASRAVRCAAAPAVHAVPPTTPAAPPPDRRRARGRARARATARAPSGPAIWQFGEQICAWGLFPEKALLLLLSLHPAWWSSISIKHRECYYVDAVLYYTILLLLLDKLPAGVALHRCMPEPHHQAAALHTPVSVPPVSASTSAWGYKSEREHRACQRRKLSALINRAGHAARSPL